MVRFVGRDNIGLGSHDAAVGVHVYRNAPVEIALEEVEVLHGSLVDVLKLAFYIGAGCGIIPG